jgi:uncharacterized protein YkwD
VCDCPVALGLWGNFMQRRHHRCAGAVVVLALLTLVSGCAQVRARVRAAVAPAPVVRVATDGAAAEKAITARVNTVRASRGLRPLSVHPTLVNKARAWAQWMAGGGCGRDAGGAPTICHSSLSAGINVPWSLLEENVGCAAPRTLAGAVETGFENSPAHLANILNSKVHYVGVGVAYWQDHVYVAQEFMAD